MIKIALCFIINYEQVLHKEEIWKKWISYNNDIINVYFYYSNYDKIKSEWIKKRCIPTNYIKETDYYHIIPAYIGLMKYSIVHDKNNRWFCFLTDSCVPIMNPLEFRFLFFNNYNNSIFSWHKANWNIKFNRRANLHLINNYYHLKNTPYFIFTKDNIIKCLEFMKYNKETFIMISNGAVSNESLFAIILRYYKTLENKNNINKDSTIMDWSRMTSSTSPYIFKDASKENIDFIRENKRKNKYAIFLRKMDNSFPNIVLENIICKKPKNYNLLQIYCKIYYIVYFCPKILFMFIFFSLFFTVFNNYNKMCFSLNGIFK